MDTLPIGVQSKNIVSDEYPIEGFETMKRAGFSCCDFSLNAYLTNTSLYSLEVNDFFNQSAGELEKFFTPHKEAAKITGIRINQMHMPYPVYIPNAAAKINDYLMRTVAPKSLEICAFFGCPYIVQSTDSSLPETLARRRRNGSRQSVFWNQLPRWQRRET